LSKKTTLSQKK